mgnify:CR=1 FL=1
MNYFIGYDIASPKRLVALSKALETRGLRAQKSFFQCDLSPDELDQIRIIILKTINKKQDKVLIQPICNDCLGKTTILGKYGLPLKEVYIL